MPTSRLSYRSTNDAVPGHHDLVLTSVTRLMEWLLWLIEVVMVVVDVLMRMMMRMLLLLLTLMMVKQQHVYFVDDVLFVLLLAVVVAVLRVYVPVFVPHRSSRHPAISHIHDCVLPSKKGNEKNSKQANKQESRQAIE